MPYPHMLSADHMSDEVATDLLETLSHTVTMLTSSTVENTTVKDIIDKL